MSELWDFSKIPDSRIEEVLELVNSRSGGRLMAIHNDYQLSKEYYCCSVQEQYVINWFIYGRDTGKIKSKVNSPSS